LLDPTAGARRDREHRRRPAERNLERRRATHVLDRELTARHGRGDHVIAESHALEPAMVPRRREMRRERDAMRARLYAR